MINNSFFAKLLEVMQKNFFVIMAFIILQIIGMYIVFSTDKYNLHLEINSFHSLTFDYFFKYATYLGDGMVFLVVVLIVLWKRKEMFTVFLMGSLMTLLTSFVLKNYICYNYPRPYEVFGDRLHLIVGEHMRHWHSFPSGHTMSAFAMFFLMIFFTEKIYLKWIWLLLALLVGMSRIYLSQHFFEDVLGGSMIGFIIAVFAYLLGTKFSIFKK